MGSIWSSDPECSAPTARSFARSAPCLTRCPDLSDFAKIANVVETRPQESPMSEDTPPDGRHRPAFRHARRRRLQAERTAPDGPQSAFGSRY